MWYMVHRDIRILPSMVSGIPDALSLGAKVWDPHVYVVFGTPIAEGPLSSTLFSSFRKMGVLRAGNPNTVHRVQLCESLERQPVPATAQDHLTSAAASKLLRAKSTHKRAFNCASQAVISRCSRTRQLKRERERERESYRWRDRGMDGWMDGQTDG